MRRPRRVARSITAYLEPHARKQRLLRHPLKTVRERRFGTVQSGLWLVQRMKRRMARRRPFIVVACMPRTGSTFLTTALADITGFKRFPLNYAHGRNEQELYLPKLLDASSFGSVTQQHFRATQANLRLLREFQIRPVVLVRDVFDATVSIRDYMLKEHASTWPTFYSDDRFWDLSEERQFDAIIDLGLPWYFNFFVSWTEAARADEVSTLWLRYEDAMQDWSAAAKRVLEFCEIETSDSAIASSLEATTSRDPQSLRLNKGVVGRGKATLTIEQQDRIERFATYYPHVDFSMIGIDRN
jgi:hypothetical protein